MHWDEQQTEECVPEEDQVNADQDGGGANEQEREHPPDVNRDDGRPEFACALKLDCEAEAEEEREQRPEGIFGKPHEPSVDGAVKSRVPRPRRTPEVDDQNAKQREASEDIDQLDSHGAGDGAQRGLGAHRSLPGGPATAARSRIVSNQPTAIGRPAGVTMTSTRWVRVPLSSASQLRPLSRVRSRTP